MKNTKTACIFEYYDFLYTCDFDKMLMWCVNSEDENPITTLSIRRSEAGWAYRCGDSAPWLTEVDPEMIELLEKHYEQYLNQIVVGRNNTTKADKLARSRE